MITTTFKCDRCGAEDVNNGIGIERIGIHIGQMTLEQYQRKSLNNDWCKKCLIETGLIIGKQNDIPIKSSMLERFLGYVVEKKFIIERKGNDHGGKD